MKKYRIFFKETFLGRTLIWAATYLVVLFQVLPALALPQGETVVNGDVTFERNGNQMTVNQGTGRAIVNYNGFDIDRGEGVRFAQPDARAAILNRVTGPGSSAIAGELSANGRVFLINPNGILFTPSAQVDVGALVASALNLSDSDFMAGNLRFYGGAGSVVNEGMLNGGFVYLVGGTVENKGTINADDVVLAAGQSVLIDKAVDGEIRVTIDGEVASSNQLASSMANDPTGLADTSSSGTNSSSVADAELASVMNQAAQGASEVWEVGTIINKGTINVSGDVGGTVLAQGKQVGQFGTIDADGLVGDGGKIDLHASDVVVLSADSVTKANAGLNGDGGRILIVGEHAATIATGARIEAKGGTQSGNGGFVETSGKESFRIGAAPDVSASHGQGGTWLIDPYDVVITNGAGFVNFIGNPFNATGSNAVLGVDLIYETLLDGVNVQISTESGGGGQAGDITWLAGANLNYNGTHTNSLTLNAANNINIGASISDSNNTADRLNLVLEAGGNVLVSNSISLGGGNFTSRGIAFRNSGSGTIITDGGDITINHRGSVSLGAHINADSGNISLTGASVTNDGSAKIMANTLTAHASGEMTLNTTVRTLVATNRSGAIDVTETDGITLANVRAGNGPITVTAGGPITASNVVSLTDNAANDIRLTGNGIMAGTINAGSQGDVTLEAGAGAITDLPSGMISGDKLTAHARDAMTLNTMVATLEATNRSGAIDVTETDGITLANVRAGNGPITVTAGGPIMASNVVSLTDNAANDIRLTGNGIMAGTINAGSHGDVTLEAGAGAITNLSSGVIISGDKLTAYARDAMTLNTEVETLVATNSSGAIQVRETDGITLKDVQAGNGLITVTAGGAITADKVMSLTDSNNISLLTTNGDIQIGTVDAKTLGDVTLTTPGSILRQSLLSQISGNKLTAHAGDAMTLDTSVTTLEATNANGVIDVTETDGITLANVRAGNGPITVTAGGPITASNVVSLTDNAANDIRLTGNGIMAGTINAGSHGDVTLEAGAGAITDLPSGMISGDKLTAHARDAMTLNTMVATLEATNRSGAIDVTETDGITLANVRAGNGPITVTAGGPITASNVVSLTDNAANDIRLTGNGIMAGTINAGSQGDVTLEAGAGAITDLPSGMISGDKLTAHARDAMTLNTMVATLEATNRSGAIDVTETDGITLANVRAGNGPITVTAGGPITASNVVSLTENADNDISLTGNGIMAGTINAGSQGDVTLEAGAGAITDLPGKISGNTLTAHADGAMRLDTSVATLEATNRSGAIDVTETDGITLANVRAGNGPITVTAGGPITASNVVSLTENADNDISLTGNGIMAGTINAGSQGDVTLEAGAGAITDLPSGMISGDKLTAHARDAMTLNTMVATLEATNRSGAIDVTETDGITLANVRAGNGPITVTAGGPITASNVVSLTENAYNDISLTGNGIMAGTINAGSQGDVTLEAGAGAITDLPSGMISGDKLTAHARDAMTLNTMVATLEATNRSGAIDVTETDGITLANVRAGNGPITVTAGGPITASNVVSLTENADNDISLTGNGIMAGTINAGSQGDVTLEAGAGAITDLPGKISGNTLTAHADGAMRLDTSVATLEATNRSGAIDVTETDGITLANVQAGSGSITVRAGGSIAASNVVSLTDNADNDILLTAMSGDIQAGTVHAGMNLLLNAMAGNVTLNSKVTSAAGNISVLAANSVQQNAGGDITIENGLGTIDVEGTTGSVTMADGTVSQTAGGNIRYKAGQNVTLGQLNAGTGMVAVTASNDITGSDNITASATLLKANGQISISNAFGGIVAAESGHDIYITGESTNEIIVGEVGPVKVNRVNADSTLTTLTNDVLRGLTATNGSIRLIAGGTITVSNAILAASNICVVAGNNIDLNADVKTAGNGAIALWADHDSNGTGDVTQRMGTVESVDGSIYAAGFNIYQSSLGAIKTVGLGSIMVKASNNLDMAGTISSGSGDLAMGAGQMVINGTLSARRTLILRADNGSITGDGKAIAQNIGLSASRDIGTRTHRFVVDADTLATSKDGGNVYLQELTSVKAGLVRFSDIGGNGMPQCAQSMPGLNIGDLDGINSHDYLDLAVGDNLSGNKVFARGSADISVGGEINTLDMLDINGDANLAIDGDTVIDQLNIGGALLLNGGGGFSFNDLTAGQIDVTVDGTIDMGRVDAGTVIFKAGGSVSDNNSMLNVSGALTIEAGGNVGDAGKPINLNVRTIGSVSGDNVYLLQNAAGDVMVDTIVARNHLDLGVPNGRILDAVDDGDWASPQINIFANSARLDAQQIGERRNPLDLKIAGDIEVVNSVPGPDQGPGYVWVRLQGDVGNKVVPDYNLTVPGLIILNNQIVGGADAVMREIFRTEAFYVETPELKSKYGVFGSPYFLHSYLQISEPVAIGLIDYILYGQAKVTADPDLPPIPNIIKGGPKAGYVVRLTAKPLIP